MTLDSTTQVVESVGTKNVETKETGPSAQDASSTAATTVVPVVRISGFSSCLRTDKSLQVAGQN
jgi:hypothetical protein